MNSVNQFDIEEEVKDISKLIKEEIAGLIKSEVKFEMSHVPEFPHQMQMLYCAYSSSCRD
jgi:hypothetical protein